jgi:C_GCAxxG_C_C family probable redox protein
MVKSVELMEKSEELVKKSKQLLFKTFNCCESQIVPIDLLYNSTDSPLRSSVSGLAGGINNNGSTCGVVFGGALNLAIMHRSASSNWDVSNEVNLLYSVQKFVKSFEEKFGSSLCRERTGLNLRKFSGKMGLLNPSKVKGCVKQTAWAMNFISQAKINTQESSEREYSLESRKSLGLTIQSIDHCSNAIFNGIKCRTGITHPYMQQLTTGLSGGIGLSGSGCAALSSAIIILGLEFGNKVFQNDKRRNPLKVVPKKFDKAANKLIDLFTEKFGSLECRNITNTTFKDINSFNDYRSMDHCDEINKFLIDFLSDYIKLEKSVKN